MIGFESTQAFALRVGPQIQTDLDAMTTAIQDMSLRNIRSNDQQCRFKGEFASNTWIPVGGPVLLAAQNGLDMWIARRSLHGYRELTMACNLECAFMLLHMNLITRIEQAQHLISVAERAHKIARREHVQLTFVVNARGQASRHLMWLGRWRAEALLQQAASRRLLTIQ
jgi:hypothetical protein